MWKVLAQSAPGTSHLRHAQPCQDSCVAVQKQSKCGAVLVIACADGAGTARHGDVGAARLCQEIVRLVLDDLGDRLPVGQVERNTVLYWCDATRRHLQEEAQRLECTPRDLAATTLLAVVGESAAAFAQLGDGAIVALRGDDYQPVFWPQSGEYANATNFLTDPNFEKYLLFEQRAERVAELALFTDGLQRLALDYRTQTAHRPFFEPMYRRLREAASADELQPALEQYLNSAAINQRTDDDKTLILATRLAADGAPTHPA
jgi:hypothetical protein